MAGVRACVPGATFTTVGTRMGKRTLSSKYWGTVFWLLIDASDQRGAKKWGSHLCCISSHWYKPFLLWLKWISQDFKGPLFPSSPFAFSSFENQPLKTRTLKIHCICSKIRKWYCIPREKAQKRTEKTLSLYFRLILGTESSKTIKKQKQ